MIQINDRVDLSIRQFGLAWQLRCGAPGAAVAAINGIERSSGRRCFSRLIDRS